MQVEAPAMRLTLRGAWSVGIRVDLLQGIEGVAVIVILLWLRFRYVSRGGGAGGATWHRLPARCTDQIAEF